MKKLFSYLVRTVLALFGLGVLLVLLLYFPPLQRFLGRRLAAYVSVRYGPEVRLGSLRLGFPFDLELQEVYVGLSPADTLAAADTIRLRAGLGKIWKGTVLIHELSVQNMKFRLENDSSGICLKAGLQRLALQDGSLNLPERRVQVGGLALGDGRVELAMGGPAVADTVAGEPPGWNFGVDRLLLDRMSCRMSSPDLPGLGAGLEVAEMAGGQVSLAKREVAVDSLRVGGGWFTLHTGAAKSRPDREKTEVASESWTVRAGRAVIENSAFRMESGEGQTRQLVLSGIGLRVDDIYNRGTTVRASLKDLHAVQPGGTRIAAMQAEVDLDSALTSLQGTYLETPYSRLLLEVRADTSVQQLLGRVPLSAKVSGKIGLEDIRPYYSGLPRELQQQTVLLSAAVQLSASQLEVDTLHLEMPGCFGLEAEGRLADYRHPERMSGVCRLAGDVQHVRWIEAFLGETGVRVPDRLRFSFQGSADTGVFRAGACLCRDDGCLFLDGSCDVGSQEYAGKLVLQDFPLGDFLPVDSLGTVTASVEAEGARFSWPGADAVLKVQLGQLDFGGYDYRNIGLEARLEQTSLRGTLVSRDSALPLRLIFRADSADGRYAATLNGQVGEVDLEALHVVGEPLAVRSEIEVRASAVREEGRYTLEARFDSLRLRDARRVYRLRDVGFGLKSGRRETELELNTGDLHFAFHADTSLAGFAEQARLAAERLIGQVGERNIEMQEISRELPDFTLEVEGAQQNAVAGFLKTRSIGFRHLFAQVRSRKRNGLRVGMQVNAPYFRAVRLDSVRVGVWQSGNSLVYGLEAGSSAESWKGLLNLNVAGRIQGNRLRFELEQKDAAGRTGFDLGMNLTLQDSSFVAGFFPASPVLGYARWRVNAGNYIAVGRDWKMSADLRMAYQNKLVSLQSLPDDGERKDRLQVEITGIDLDSLFRQLPFVPDVEGVLNTDLMLYARGGSRGVEGKLQVKDLAYRQRRVGTVDLGLRYLGKKRLAEHAVDVELNIDSMRGAVLSGNFFTSAERRDLSVDVDLPAFPLYPVNAFLPEGLVEWKGELCGKLRMRGSIDRPQVDGELRFADAAVEVLALGTAFRMDTAVLAVQDGKIMFRKYRFMAPDQSQLALDGSITLLPFDRMGMDLGMKAAGFEIVDVKKNAASLVYGKAYADIDARLSGGFSALELAGKINLLNRTDITYTLRDSGTEWGGQDTDLVRFVPFRGDALEEEEDLGGRVQLNDFVLRMLLEIGDRVNVTVALSEDGSDQVRIQGGGHLVLAMNSENGLTLSGKYILSGGTVVYHVPIAGEKEFTIRKGSDVEWTGDAANPVLNISAAESVKATVREGDKNRLVNFEAMIRIQHALTHPDIGFDLAAPNDMVIQNQLSTFSPEERTRQALNLLIYNTYTAPGSVQSAGRNVADQTLYGFVENELNKYTRKAGITLGVDSYHTDEHTIRRDFTYEFSRQLFNDRIRVKIGGRISTDSGDAQQSDLEDNLVDDISIEYVLTGKRNLYVKVFRHSNYESVLDGEVTQTGVGIVWRKNFMKLGDLFRRKAEKRKGAKK